MRGCGRLDGVIRTYIERDGTDATGRIAEMVNGSKHFGQIRAILLNGITFGGFNVVDLDALYDSTRIPVITVMRNLPDMESIRLALTNLEQGDLRYEIILRAGKAIPVETSESGGPVYIQWRGLSDEDAENIIKISACYSRLPEPIRVAHMIATGVVLGESSKRA